MSRCNKCNIEILDATESCPLCRSILEQTEAMENMYPNAGHKTQKLFFFSRLYVFLALVIEFSLIGIDIRLQPQIKWSVLFGSVFLFFYIVIRFAIIGKSGYKNKLTVVVLSAVLLSITCDFATGYHGWAVNYILSSGILFVDLIILILLITNRRNWQSYMLLQILMILCSFIPLLLYLFEIEQYPILAMMPLTVSSFLFLGTWILGGRRATLELKRRFHI